MDRLKRIVGRWSFWALLAVMVGLGLLHYLTPQERPLPATSRLLERHAVERVMFLFPVAGAAFLFGRLGGLIGLVLAVLIMLPRVFLLSPYPTDAFVETVAVGVVGYLVVRMIEVAVDNARLYESARFYARQITRAQEEERKRIARDLHDETIQVLVTISRRLELATLPQQSPEATVRCLVDLQELVSDTLRGLRRFVQDLRPPALDHLGLVAALVSLANDLEEETGIEVEVKVEGEAQRLAPEQELGLFRIFQEALTNVRRHSEATQVTVEVAFYPGRMRMLIRDNGRGFAVPQRMDDLVSTGKLGLIGMVERARLFGGALVIQSEPGEGTTVVVDVPMQPGQKSEDYVTGDASYT